MLNLVQLLIVLIAIVTFAILLKEKIIPLPFGMMATTDPTTIDDIDYQSEAFKDTITAIITDMLGLTTSGIMIPVPDSMLPEKSGDFGNMPQWKTFSGTMTPIVSGTDVDINNLSTYKQRFAWLAREYAIGAEDIVKTISGTDTLGEVATKIGLFVAKNMQSIAINVIKGNFAVALASSHSTGATYSGSTISVEGVNAAKLKLGDNLSKLDRMIMHSKPHMDGVNLMIAQYGTFNREELRSGNLPKFLGMDSFLEDVLAPVASIYSTYLSEAGSIGYSFKNFSRTDVSGNPVNGIGIDIEPYRIARTSGGISALIIRLYCMIHLNGTKWVAATKNPTDVQLATGSNWEKSVDDDKKIRIVELKTR